MRYLIGILLLSVVAIAPLHAQFEGGAGIGAHAARRDQRARTIATGAEPLSLSSAATSRGRWKWVAVGALLGGAVGGTLAARQVARTEDAFFGGPVIGLGVVVGVVGGGLIGALAHTTLHPAPSGMSPVGR